MNKEELLNKVVEWTGETAEKIGDFAAKEIPPFITEYLTWKFWENAFHIILYAGSVIGAIIIVGCMVKFTMHCFKKKDENGYSSDWEFASVLSTIISAVCSVLFFCIALKEFPSKNILDCMQIKLAPKVYLVEKAAELYKQNKQ